MNSQHDVTGRGLRSAMTATTTTSGLIDIGTTTPYHEVRGSGPAVRASGVPLTVVTGEENRDSWFGAAAAWLAEGTGADRVELLGGHVGYLTHPTEFVELVRRIARPNETSQR